MRQAQILEGHVGGGPFVDGAVGLDGELGGRVRGIEIHCEERDLTVDGGGQQQLGGERGRGDHRLHAREQPVLTLAHGGGGDIAVVVTGLGFEPGEADDDRTLGDPGEQILGAFAGGALEQTAADDHGVHIRFHHECATERLGDDHGFDGPAAYTTDRFRQRRAQDADLLGQSAPHLWLPARAEARCGPAAFDVVAGREEFGDGIAEQFLFSGEGEIHGYSPRVALAMIFR